ncbi:MAG: tetratricopeptide repeat protein [Bdellovibrionota bacterium]|nr:MAG: tetratricopeptide repeat protein [Pseudomonadota bacterium]
MQNLTVKLFSGLASLWLLGACASSGNVARVDKEKRRFELQSQDDTKSAMVATDDSTTKKLITKLEVRIKDNPRDIDAMINLAQAQLASARYDKAEAACRDALRVDLKNEPARKILAQIYYRRGNLEMAQIILNGLDATRSKDSQVLNLLGMIALRQDKPEFALLSFQEALKHNPSDIAVRMNLGVLYVHYRQLGLAAIEFERILKVMPDHADANLNMAIIESSRGNLEKAEEYNKKVLSYAKTNPVAIFNLAIIEEKRKNWDKALEYVKVYLDLDYAKKRNNQEAFALIDSIRTKKEASGERVSDKEIMSLAAKAQKGKINQTSEDKEFVDAEPRLREEAQAQKASAPGAQASAPVAAPANNKVTPPKEAAEVKPAVKKDAKKKNYKNDEEEIDDLEKQLQ